ncbi:MAG: hypothetical protein COB81_01415 [Flavobacteriaceae bacterium]|nr:MAG: hypothetical protein COB81_01415 [Flavobacteriaceae bacterium]
MKNYTPILLLLVFLMFAFTSCSKDDDGIYFEEKEAPELTNAASYTGLEASIIDLLNEHRVSLGLNPLSPLDIISMESSSHTDYMIENDEISHNNFSERAAYLIENANAITVGENVAYGYSTAKGVVTGWLNSEAHRLTIENPTYTNVGISIKTNDNNRNYFTNMFIKIK